MPIVVEEREALDDGAAALLGDSAWAAALALSVWLALNPEKVQRRRVMELGSYMTTLAFSHFLPRLVPISLN